MIDGPAKELIRQRLLAAGACRVGFATACNVSDEDFSIYQHWLEKGCHASMDYMERYADLRHNPSTLLDGARTVISCAFDYTPAVRHKLFADYALGDDYHDVIRRRLKAADVDICRQYGGEMRICVDTAPIRERYWAVRANVGFIGLNGLLIVDGIGSKVFLAEILWTRDVEPDATNSGRGCKGCMACVNACPGHALDGRGGLDARHCRSYLTIEHRGELPRDLHLDGRIYGCDICQDVCPYNHNTHGTTTVDEFKASQALMTLDIETIKAMDSEGFRSIFRHSAVKRARLSGLQRNAIAKSGE